MMFINSEYILFCAGIVSQEHTIASVEVCGIYPSRENQAILSIFKWKGSAATIDNPAPVYLLLLLSFPFQVKK